MLDVKERIEIRGGFVEVDSRGVLRYTCTSEELTMDAVRCLVKCIKRLGQKKVHILFDGNSIKSSADAEVKKYLLGKINKYTSAVAIVHRNSILKFIAHTFIAVYRPKTAMKLFANEQQALDWLRSKTIDQ